MSQQNEQPLVQVRREGAVGIAMLNRPDKRNALDLAMRAAIAERLSETVLPGLSEQIVTSHTMTPQTFQDRLWSYKGAGFGQEPLLLQSAWFRPHNRSEDVPGLYMVGAGTHPGAGVPGVLMSAKALEKVVPHVHA